MGFGARLIETSLREVGGTIARRWQARRHGVRDPLPLRQVLASAASGRDSFLLGKPEGGTRCRSFVVDFWLWPRALPLARAARRARSAKLSGEADTTHRSRSRRGVPTTPSAAHRPNAMKPLLGTIMIENIGGGGGASAPRRRSRPPRRLYPAAGRRHHPRHRGAAEEPPAVRPDQGFGAGFRHRHHGVCAGTAPVGAGERPQGAVAHAKGNPGRTLRIESAGTGLARSSHRRDIQAAGRAAGLGACALSRRRAGNNRSLAGQVPMIIPAMTNHVLELHRAGKLKVVAVTHGTRLAAAPELPTAVEQGLTDLVTPKPRRDLCTRRNPETDHRPGGAGQSCAALRSRLPAAAHLRDIRAASRSRSRSIPALCRKRDCALVPDRRHARSEDRLSIRRGRTICTGISRFVMDITAA